MASVVVIDWQRIDAQDVVDLRDETTKGDWQTWTAKRIGIPEDGDVFLNPTSVPGVSLVLIGRSDVKPENWVTRRILYERHEPRFETSFPLVLEYSAFGFTGPGRCRRRTRQRVPPAMR